MMTMSFEVLANKKRRPNMEVMKEKLKNSKKHGANMISSRFPNKSECYEVSKFTISLITKE